MVKFLRSQFSKIQRLITVMFHSNSFNCLNFRELAFFYPDFVAPTVIQKRKKKRLQRTLALIRPDALHTHRGTECELTLKRLVTYIFTIHHTEKDGSYKFYH